MALWGKTSTAICKGWGMGPFVVNPPVVHPEYYFGGPYGTIPYKGGFLRELRDFRSKYDKLRDENRRLQEQLQQQQGGRWLDPRPYLPKPNPLLIGPGGIKKEPRTWGKNYLLGVSPEDLEILKKHPARNSKTLRRQLNRLRRINTLKQGFDQERMRDQMRDIWKNQQVESETTFFDNPEEEETQI